MYKRVINRVGDKMTQFNLFLVAVLSSVSVTSAFANDDLAKVMDDMSSNVKTITKQASDATQNASSATLCDKVIADIAQAESLAPDSVAKLPADQQAASQQAYSALLGQLSDQFSTLKADFEAGNSSAAVSELAAINATKASGHKQFN
jgi:hypothetical protein